MVCPLSSTRARRRTSTPNGNHPRDVVADSIGVNIAINGCAVASTESGSCSKRTDTARVTPQSVRVTVFNNRFTALLQGDRRLQLLLGAAIVVVVLGVGIGLAGSGTTLVVEDIETGETYLTAPVENGSTVALEYTHSVEKSRVYDGYRVDGETLVNTRMEFESYGWGLPARVNVTNVDGTLVYAPDEPITELQQLSVSPGRIANHTLIINGTRHDLVALSEGRDVTIYTERQTGIDRIERAAIDRTL